MHSLSADNWHIGRYIVQSADIVLSADDRMSADYLQYRIGRISLSANFPNLDIVCTLSARTLGEYILLPERIKKGMSPTPEEDPLRESDIGGRDEGG